MCTSWLYLQLPASKKLYAFDRAAIMDLFMEGQWTKLHGEWQR
jgi:hypothetical protein